MEQKIRLLGLSGKRASSKKCKFFHEDVFVFLFVFFCRTELHIFITDSEPVLCGTENDISNALFSYLFVVIRQFSVEKKHQETNYSVTFPPKKEAGKCSIWVWYSQAPRLRHMDFQGPPTPPKHLVCLVPRRGNTASLILLHFIGLQKFKGKLIAQCIASYSLPQER